jgi:hypothetical protein
MGIPKGISTPARPGTVQREPRSRRGFCEKASRLAQLSLFADHSGGPEGLRYQPDFLSLKASCKFRFRRPAGEKWERFTLVAEPRSLYMMSGASRHIWEHSIPAVEQRRYSITFRTMKTDKAGIAHEPPSRTLPA